MTQQQLFDYLNAHYSMDELRILCFQLGIDHEQFDNRTKSVFARELVEYFVRRDKLWKLEDAALREPLGLAQKFQRFLGVGSRFTTRTARFAIVLVAVTAVTLIMLLWRDFAIVPDQNEFATQAAATSTEIALRATEASVSAEQTRQAALAISQAEETQFSISLTRTRNAALVSPTGTPTASVTPRCGEIADEFRVHWTPDNWGCASGPSTAETITWQEFERGSIFYWPGNGRIYVLFNSGAWEVLLDESSIAGSDLNCAPLFEATAPGLRQISWAWCTHDRIQSALGAPTSEQVPVTPVVQVFERGFMMRFDPIELEVSRLSLENTISDENGGRILLVHPDIRWTG